MTAFNFHNGTAENLEIANYTTLGGKTNFDLSFKNVF